MKVGKSVVVAWRVTSNEHDKVLEYVRTIHRIDGFAFIVRRHRIA